MAMPTSTAPPAPRCPRRSSRRSGKPSVPDRERGRRVPGQRTRGHRRRRMPPRDRRPVRHRRRRRARAEHDHAHLPAGGHIGPAVEARRRDRRVRARPRRQHPALGAGCRADVGAACDGPKSTALDRGTAGGPVPRPASVRAHPTRSRHGRQQRRFGTRPDVAPSRPPRPGRRALITWTACTPRPHVSRRRATRRGLLRHQRLQMVRATHRHRRRRPGLPRDAPPGQAGAGPVRRLPAGSSGAPPCSPTSPG